MLYIEYHNLKKEYKEADKYYDKILEKKAKLYYGTQPGAVDTSKEIVGGGVITDKFCLFIQQLEKLEPELNKARNDRDLKNYFLKKKEIELRESSELLDRIYVLRYLGKMKVNHIAIRINYSREQTYRYLREIEEKCNYDTKWHKTYSIM